MPWVDEQKCTGCNICAAKCPVGAISMDTGKAEIDMHGCIRCGTCHSLCPNEAVRHDSEKIPENVQANVWETKRFMELCAKHLNGDNEKGKCLQRMLKHFNKEKLVAEKTIQELERLKNSVEKL